MALIHILRIEWLQPICIPGGNGVVIIDSNFKIGDFPSSNFVTTIIGGGTGNFPVCIHCAHSGLLLQPRSLMGGRNSFSFILAGPISRQGFISLNNALVRYIVCHYWIPYA
jgi:hypothetical protein